MRWIRRRLRGNEVYVRVGADGKPDAGSDGRVDVVYKLADGAKLYRASPRNLEPTGVAADERPVSAEIELTDPGKGAAKGAARGRKKPAGGAPSRPIPDDAIIIYTDGACTGNPGPAGIGAVIMDGAQRREISEYLGTGTNNIAELTAILRALEVLPAAARARPVLVHSDSSYSIGLLSKGWKAKANADLVAKLRALVARFSDLELVKVKGHAGVPENERADELARLAIETR